MRRTLVLFVRMPLLGAGKRRLARDIGDIAALRFERAMIALLLRRLAKDRRWRLRIAVTPDKACRRAHTWRTGVETVGQGQGDLGIRMRRALEACRPGQVVLVGADIPALDARHAAAAFRLLGSHDLVFGPAADGGFWLVGARHPRRLPPLLSGCGGRAPMPSPTRSPACLGVSRSAMPTDWKTWTTGMPIAG